MARQTLASLQQEVIDWLVNEFREFKKAEQDYRIRQDLEKVCIEKVVSYQTNINIYVNNNSVAK